ncbi:MAG: thioredoxin family protein [Rikenellaceae bacterium]
MRRYTFLLLLLLATLPTFGQVTWGEPVIQKDGENYTISVSATIDDGWHIYDMEEYDFGLTSTSVTLALPAGVEVVGGVEASQKPVRKFDEIFGTEIGYFEGQLTLTQQVKITASVTERIGVAVEWMSCNEGSCMPPSEVNFEVELPRDNSGMWWLIVEAVLWGFAALLTPCVFPMVPMTISFFMKGSGGRMVAMLYGLFIVALYTLPIGAIVLSTYLLGGDAVMGDIFNWLATHWVPNVLFFVVFMIFAASFFGAFEITLPSSWVNRSDDRADKGSIVGIFFLALTLVLVSFSCTGPIVGTVLIASTQGEFWTPIATIFAFSSAFALPFVVFAMFPTLLKSMPKSGGWLGSVKVVLGFLELALGLKFLSVADQTYHWGVLDREIYLALWIVIFTMLGFYLLGKIRFSHDAEVKTIGVGRLGLSIVVFSFVVYMIPGMWGAPLRGLSGYLPPLETQDFVMGQYAVVQQNNSSVKYGDVMGKSFPNGLDGFYDLDEARAYAREVNKPLLIDFTGHGCVNCRAMEQNVWSDSRVNQLLRDDYVIVALYMDDKHELPKEEWITTQSGRVLKTIGRVNSYLAMETYGVNAQPYYIIEGLNGEQLAPSRGYDLNVDAYIDFLEQGVNNFRK